MGVYSLDYNSKGRSKWNQLYESIALFKDDVGLIQIPHHGAKCSFNKGILDINFDSEFFISCGVENSYNHPHDKVVKDLIFHHSNFYVITEKNYSKLTYIIRY